MTSGTLDYVMSGTSYTRMHAATDRPEIIQRLNEITGKVKEETNHKFSMLYNAFMEQSFGNTFKQFTSLEGILRYSIVAGFWKRLNQQTES